MKKVLFISLIAVIVIIGITLLAVKITKLKQSTKYSIVSKEQKSAVATTSKDSSDGSVIFSQVKSEKNGISQQLIRIDSSKYSIDNLEHYQEIKIDGFEQLLAQSRPIVPFKKITIKLPPNTSIDNTDVEFENRKNLGEINIPAFQMPPPMPDDNWDSGPVDCPRNLGIFPEKQYETKTVDMGGYQELIINIYPLTYDTASKKTFLYQNININITYATLGQGFVEHFYSNNKTYKEGDIINTKTNIQNSIGEKAVFKVILEVQDLSDKVIVSSETMQEIEGGQIASVQLSLKAPNIGPYRLIMTAYDARNNIIGDGRKDIQVK